MPIVGAIHAVDRFGDRWRIETWNRAGVTVYRLVRSGSPVAATVSVSAVMETLRLWQGPNLAEFVEG
jgi:hypothetical protein